MAKKDLEPTLLGLIPTSVKYSIEPDIKCFGKVHKTPMLMSKDGQRFPLKGMPMIWVNYISECVNNFHILQDQLGRAGHRIIRSTVIVSITVPGAVLPITESKTITKTTDGQYILEYSREYRQWLNGIRQDEWKIKASLKREELPINYPIRVEFIFYRKRSRKHAALSELIDSMLQVLVKFGIIKNKSSHIVKSVDGSKIVHTGKTEETAVIIHTSMED